MYFKNLFAKKTTNNMKNFGPKEWAKSLQAIYTPLINIANISRKMKQLLKDYDATNDDNKKDKYKEQINDTRSSMEKDWRILVENFDDAFKVMFADYIEDDTDARLNDTPEAKAAREVEKKRKEEEKRKRKEERERLKQERLDQRYY